MKNSNDTIGNRTRDLPARGALPQTKCATAFPETVHYGQKAQQALKATKLNKIKKEIPSSV